MSMVSDISQLDPLMAGATSVDTEDIEFYNVKSEPFRLYGLCDAKNGDHFKRLPEEVAAATSDAVLSLSKCTAGGRVRFSTDSDRVVIFAKEPHVRRMYHATLMMSAGFDMYLDDPLSGDSRFYGIFKAPYNMKNGYVAEISFPSREIRHLTVNFPLYGEVSELYIGICKGSTIGEGAKYCGGKPIVFYGSSITQGGCASRSGIAYTSIVARKLNMDHLNLGFSGNGRAENAIVEYMAGLDMAVFVSDYDHNAPTVEHLKNTHYKMYETIRAANPELPYVMISRPDFVKRANDVADSVARREVILESYRRALNEKGDKNVYFIDGESFFNNDFADCTTVDGTHPTDFGMVCMAEKIGRVLKDILE